MTISKSLLQELTKKNLTEIVLRVDGFDCKIKIHTSQAQRMQNVERLAAFCKIESPKMPKEWSGFRMALIKKLAAKLEHLSFKIPGIY